MDENLNNLNVDRATSPVNTLNFGSNFDNANSEPEPSGFLGFLSSKKRVVSFFIGFLIISAIAFFLFKFFSASKKISPQPVTLLYWGIWEDQAVMSGIISDFEREYPNIKIAYEKQDIKSLGQYINRLRTRQENNTGPDILRFHNSWLPEIKNLLLPLPQDTITTSGINKDYYPVVRNDVSLNGAYYGIPLSIDDLVLLANQDLFQKAGIDSYPSTWDDLVKSSRSLTVKTADGTIQTSGVALGTFDNIAHAADIVSLLLVQNGADIYNIKGPSRKNAEDALYFYTSFATSQDAKVWDSSMENSKLAFAKGRAAMIFAYSWDILDIKSLNPNLNIKVLPVPSLPGRNKDIASYWAEGVSLKTKHPKEAFLFMNYLARSQTLEKLYQDQAKTRLFGGAYPRISMADLLKNNSYLYPIVSQAQDAVSTPFSSDTYDDAMNASLVSYLGDAVRGVLSGNVSAASAIDTLADGINQSFATYAK